MRLQLTKCLFISLLLNSTNIFSVPVRDPNNCRTTYVNILEKMMVNAPDSIIKFTCGKYEEALYKLSDAQVKQLDFFSNVYLNQTVAKEIMLTARNEISPYTSNPIVISNFSNDWAEETLRMLNSKQPIGSRFSHTLKDHVKIMFNEPTMAAKPVFVPQMPTPSAPPVQTHYPTHNNNYNKSFPNYGSLLSVEEERYVQNSKKFVNRLLHLEDRNLFCVFSTRDSQLLEYFLTQESVKTKSSYLELANNIAQPRASCAVGQANGKNRLSIIIPCHRVITARGEIGGYGGGVDRKMFLLEFEKKHLKQGNLD